MSTTLKIADIKYVEELYPRFKFDNETVDKYRLNIENLPPIKVQKEEKILIDGYHRLVAHQLEGREEIEAELEDVPRDQILWLAVKYNSTHGLQLGKDEKEILARHFYSNNGVSQQEIANVLAVSQKTISNWLSNLVKEENEKRDLEILDLYLSCYAQEEIAEKLGVDQKTISNVKKRIRKNSNFTKIPNSPLRTNHVYDVWNFSSCSHNTTFISTRTQTLKQQWVEEKESFRC